MTSANTSMFELPSCSDSLIWQLHFSQAQYICFKSSIRNKVYDIVQKDQPIERSELIKKANYGTRGGEAVIHVITALGLLKCVDGKYSLTEQSDLYLTHSSVFSWKSILNYFPQNFIPDMEAIERENHVNKELVGEWSQGSAISDEKAAQFSGFMQSLHMTAANGLAKLVDFRKKFNVTYMLDVAGGSGCFTIALAHHQPGVRGTIFELDAVCKVAQQYIEKSGLPSDTVLTYSGNMFKDEYPSNDDPKYGYQACFYSNIFHDWNEEKCKYLAKKTYDALPKNGVIMLHEMLLNEDGNGPLVTTFLTYEMFIRTEGKQFTFSELKTLLTGAGFSDIQVIPAYGFFSLVCGVKN